MARGRLSEIAAGHTGASSGQDTFRLPAGPNGFAVVRALLFPGSACGNLDIPYSIWKNLLTCLRGLVPQVLRACRRFVSWFSLSSSGCLFLLTPLDGVACTGLACLWDASMMRT